MKPIELEIKSCIDDRLDVARILVKNGYRVWTETRKSTGSARVTVLIVDKPERRVTE